jgi:putative SOS response-associated peptidase YedK
LGGLYDEWTDRITGEVTKGFSIITVPANPLMEIIHNTKKRMPLIIPRDNETEWLDIRFNKEQVAKMIQPFPEEQMLAEECGDK